MKTNIFQFTRKREISTDQTILIKRQQLFKSIEARLELKFQFQIRPVKNMAVPRVEKNTF